jgi:hypothetical protein
MQLRVLQYNHGDKQPNDVSSSNPEAGSFPQHAIVLEMKDHDDSGDDRVPCGGRAFHRQLRRLRCGELVEDLRVVRDDP